MYAQELDEDGNVVDEWEDTPEGEAFGRIAAQSFKQVMQFKLREAKREKVYEMYEGREGDLVTGIVQQVDYRSVILDLGDAEAILPGSERIPFERLDRGNRVKALILEVRNEVKGSQIVVSRSHPDLVRRLLELEVPELTDGTVEIVRVVRGLGFGLDQNAIEALRQWEFRPAMRNGEAVDVSLNVEVNFNLR